MRLQGQHVANPVRSIVMKSFAVTVHLSENELRGIYSEVFPKPAGVYTIIVKAKDYAGAMKKLALSDDCLKVEISPIYEK